MTDSCGWCKEGWPSFQELGVFWHSVPSVASGQVLCQEMTFDQRRADLGIHGYQRLQPRTVVVGISGYAQSGKTTAANFIERTYGVERRHIAEPLRAMLAVLLKANLVPEDLIPRYLTGDLKETLIPEIGRTSRELQISLGTEWGRQLVDQSLWARTWRRSIKPGDRVMNDSVRFPNEEDEIRQKQGFTILIKRAGTHPIAFKWGAFGRFLYHRMGLMWGVHDSERTDRLKPDHVVDNDGDLDELHNQIQIIMALEGVPVLGYLRA